MRGVVFTEFLDFIEATMGPDMVEDVILASHLPHGGAYTSVGTYPFAEMQRLLTTYSLMSGAEVGATLRTFGEHLCRRLAVKYPDFFAIQPTLFDFLDSVDRHIHVEVHKLYPDAELPRFTVRRREEDRMVMDYRSCRPLAAMAQGMIAEAASHYRETVTVEVSAIADDGQPAVRFVISRAA